MKTVLHIQNLIPVISHVPRDWIECSILREYRPSSEFKNPDESGKSRTNCTFTYEQTSEQNIDLRCTIATIIKSSEYSQLKHELQTIKNAIECALHIDTVIEQLQTLKQTNPNAMIVITQSGYYASGQFATLHDPVHLKNKLARSIALDNFYSIGHSKQDH